MEHLPKRCTRAPKNQKCKDRVYHTVRGPGKRSRGGSDLLGDGGKVGRVRWSVGRDDGH